MAAAIVLPRGETAFRRLLFITLLCLFVLLVFGWGYVEDHYAKGSINSFSDFGWIHHDSNFSYGAINMSNSSFSGWARRNPSGNDLSKCSDHGSGDDGSISTGHRNAHWWTFSNVLNARRIKHPKEVATALADNGDPNTRYDVFRFTTHGIVARLRVAWSLVQSAIGIVVNGETVWVRKSIARDLFKD